MQKVYCRHAVTVGTCIWALTPIVAKDMAVVLEGTVTHAHPMQEAQETCGTTRKRDGTMCAG